MKAHKIKEIEQLIKGFTRDTNITNELISPPCFVMRKTEQSLIFGDLHHHDLYEILYVISGKINYSIEENHYELNEGDLIFVPPTMLHKLNSTISKESRRFVLNFSEEYAKKLSTPNCDLLKSFEIATQRKNHKITLEASDRKTLEKYFNLMVELQFSNEYGDDLAFNLRYCLAMLLINKITLNSRDERQLVSTTNKIVSEVVEFINQNFDKNIYLCDIAKKLSLSESRLSHLFKDETGISIHQFLIKKRLMHAKEYIRKGEHINVVYALCGFNDNTSFFRAFKKEYHITPKQYYQNYKLTLE